MTVILFMLLSITSWAGPKDHIEWPHGIKQLSFYSDRQVDGEAQQQVFVVQEEMIGQRQFFVVMMHLGDEALNSRQQSPRRIKVLPREVALELKGLLGSVTEEGIYLRTSAFRRLCGDISPSFGITLRRWAIGRQNPLGSHVNLLCLGASERFHRLRQKVENIYWFSDRTLMSLKSELIEEEKIEALIRESFRR